MVLSETRRGWLRMNSTSGTTRTASAATADKATPRLSTDFWKFWTGQTVSNLGSTVTIFVLPLLIYRLTGSALNLGIAYLLKRRYADAVRLLEAARNCFKLEKVFVAPLEAPDRMRRRIEGAIAKQIRKDKVASSLFPPDVRYLPRLSTETAVVLRVVTPRKILGLPEQLEV